MAEGASAWFEEKAFKTSATDRKLALKQPAKKFGRVKELMVPASRAEAAAREAEALKAVDITEVDMQWLQVLSEGWASPLRGFMREEEYLQCLHFSQLPTNANGLNGGGAKSEAFFSGCPNHSMPIVLPLSEEDKKRVEDCSAITLRSGDRRSSGGCM